MGISGTDLALMFSLSGTARSGATRAGWKPVGKYYPLFALSGVARSGATRAGYTSPKVCISVGGVERAWGKSVVSYEIEALTLTSNGATFDAKGWTPTAGMAVLMRFGSINNTEYLFAGTVLNVVQKYVGSPANQQWGVVCIDHTWGMDTHKVSGHYTGSATTIAQSLISSYASGYTAANVEAGMETVDGGITYTNEDLTACVSRLMKRVGGSWYCDYAKDLHAWVTADPALITNPTDLTGYHTTFSDFVVTRDLSQVVTRVHVEGGGGAALSGVAVGETILPVDVADWYSVSGGVVVAGPQRITYTGRSLGGGGGLVGPGAAPSAAPVPALASGAGLEDGLRSYAVAFVTASGESLVGPVAAITVGAVAAPTTAPTAGAPTIGTGPNPGSHDYATTFVTASGETTAGPSVTRATTATAAPTTGPSAEAAVGAGVDDGPHDYAVTFVTSIGETRAGPIGTQAMCGAVTSGYVDEPASAPSAANGPDYLFGDSTTEWAAGDLIYYAVTYLSVFGETTPSSVSSVVVATDFGYGYSARVILVTSIPVSADADCTGKRVYRNRNGAWAGYVPIGNAVTSLMDGVTAIAGSPPAENTTSVTTDYNRVSVSAIPLGDANCTSRKLYRRSAGAESLKLVDTGASLANNTTTTYRDVAANAALGAAPPSSSTAYLQRIALSAIPTGGALVTSRKIYRTAAGGTQRKLLATIADNTTTSYVDTVTDASLGANVPTSNTATANQVTLSGIPIGAATVISRKVYRTAAGGAQLKLQQTIANNTATTAVTDATADAGLGADAPSGDASGLAQPSGQVLAGATSLVVAGTGPFSSTGGWAVIGNGQQVIRYTGVTASSLTGIPASGAGAIIASIGYNSTVTAAPQLTGIPASGAGAILYAILKGDSANLFVTRNDTAAQTALAALLGGDGVKEDYLQDRRLAQPECEARGDAQLALRGTIEESISYVSRDKNTRSGRPIRVDLLAPTSVSATFRIQQVTVTNFVPAMFPNYRVVQASGTRLDFEALLRYFKETR